MKTGKTFLQEIKDDDFLCRIAAIVLFGDIFYT